MRYYVRKFFLTELLIIGFIDELMMFCFGEGCL